jgi:hypothetical protein
MRPEGLGEYKNSPHLISNPRPSGFQHSALSIKLPRVPDVTDITDIYFNAKSVSVDSQNKVI